MDKSDCNANWGLGVGSAICMRSWLFPELALDDQSTALSGGSRLFEPILKSS